MKRILHRATLLAAGTAALVAVFTAGIGQALARTNYAMVVGVTAYPNLPKRNWLVGPRNDALLVRDFLTTQAHVPFEPQNVFVLADDVEGGREPTLAGILGSLDEIAEKAGPDDFVYLQFSGHGFQQTAADPSTETDGLDEIFLPKDTGRWVDRAKGMPNALVDDEVGKALTKIRAKGAFVWVVFDACHSGTATRAAPGDDVQERKIDPDAVGMPAEILIPADGSRSLSGEAPAAAPMEIDMAPSEAAEMGGMVAFFAAQTDETTPEMPLPRGAKGAPKYGLFTHTLFSELGANPNVSYRQLAQGILQHYAAINRSSTTPLFEGDLDAPVFGTEVDDFIPQWPIAIGERGVEIPAGRIHGLSEGARLAILDKPGASEEEAIGYLEVSSLDTFKSRLVIAGPDDADEAADTSDMTATAETADETGRAAIRTVSEIPENAFARLVETRFDFVLRVARPEPSGEFPEAVAGVNALLDDIAGDDTRQMSVELVDPGQPADLRLAVFSEASLPDAAFDASAAPGLWFLPEAGTMTLEDGRRPPSIIMQSGDDDAVGEALAYYLSRIYRATNLARISQGSDYGPDEVTVDFTLQRMASGKEEQISATAAPRAVPQDRVRVTATNNTDNLVDLNILYIGSDYSITHMAKERLQPSATYDEVFLEFTDESFGRETMVAIFTEAFDGTQTEDLGFLAQDGLKQTMRGGGASIADAIRAMGMGGATRAAKAVGGTQSRKARGSVRFFPVLTVPKG
ncbi:MAG: caspase family protein [Nitratireductor sp.]